MLKFMQGNILESDCYALVNTVNTVGVMGKGVALRFKTEFPNNYSVYRDACLARTCQIGSMLAVKDASFLMGERLIINFPTKTNWRLPSEYGYIHKGLISLKLLIKSKQIDTIAIPALGCGNGGLSWSKVRLLIIEQLATMDARIEIYEPFI
jgi:O-acetyl-ADP-ribose deacetylase (regulator of RNase III)